MRFNQFEDRDFEEIVRSCPDDRTLVQGKFAYQLDQYMPYFDREQINIITIDELRDKPRETMSSIYRFLGQIQLHNTIITSDHAHAHLK